MKEESHPGETRGQECKCGRCHRVLTDLASRMRGYGKVCWNKRYRQPELFEEIPCGSK